MYKAPTPEEFAALQLKWAAEAAARITQDATDTAKAAEATAAQWALDPWAKHRAGREAAQAIAAAVEAAAEVITSARTAAAAWDAATRPPSPYWPEVITTAEAMAEITAAMDEAVAVLEAAIAGEKPAVQFAVVKACTAAFGYFARRHPAADALYERLGGVDRFTAEYDGASGSSYDD